MFAAKKYNNDRRSDNSEYATPSRTLSLNNKQIPERRSYNNSSRLDSSSDEDESTESVKDSPKIRNDKESNKIINDNKELNKIRNEFKELQAKYDNLEKQNNVLEASVKTNNFMHDIYKEQKLIIKRLETLEKSRDDNINSCKCSSNNDKSCCTTDKSNIIKREDFDQFLKIEITDSGKEIIGESGSKGLSITDLLPKITPK